MKSITRWIVRKTIKDYQNTGDIHIRARYGYLEAVSSIIVNLILFIIKVFFGLSLNSVSLIADAVHTLTDTGSSIVILIGFRIAKKPGDKEHPFGHGRAEYLAALIVAIILIVAGFELLKSSTIRVFNPIIEADNVNILIVSVLTITMVIKELIARFARELGWMIESTTLEADFWHHRCDAISTALVLMAMLFSHLGYTCVDGIIGVCVSVIVLYSGYIIARDAISPLLGQRPSQKLLDEIKSTVLAVDGVEGIHGVIVHHYGHKNLVSLHIEVADDKPILLLHEISEDVEDMLEERLSCHCVVHIDPINKNHPRYSEFDTVIDGLVRQYARVKSYHGLHIIGHSRRVKVILNIMVGETVGDDESAAIVKRFYEDLDKKLPGIEFIIKLDPKYAYTENG